MCKSKHDRLLSKIDLQKFVEWCSSEFAVVTFITHNVSSRSVRSGVENNGAGIKLFTENV